MTSIDELRAERLKKKQILEDAGINPYPGEVARTHTTEAVQSNFEALSESRSEVTMAGRVMVVRGQGAIFFCDFQDGTDRFQAVFKQDEMPEANFDLFSAVVDAGDFIEMTGTLFTTKRGQPSLQVKSWRMLAKSLLPLPDKYHGLQNEEEQFRKRYLNLLLDSELRDLFRKKEQFWHTTRTFLTNNGFMEVETPTIEVTTGGAEARPFRTHHNDFDLDVFLRISVGELWQKKLMAAGFEKTFEIGRVYRNEGTSPEHVQEFTNMEFYWAYADYRDGMQVVQDLYRRIATEVFGGTQFTYKEHTFDLSDEWPEVGYVSEIEKQTGVNVITATEEDMKAKLDELGVSYEGENKERLMDTLWKYCRKHIAGPAFLVNHPTLVAPLSKEVFGQKDITQKFQVLLAGSEVGTGYTELNDPVDQKKRFEEQQKLLEDGDEEAMMMDASFIEMLEHGMPPTCGFGFGERLFAILSNKPMREVQLFPLMRPKEKE